VLAANVWPGKGRAIHL